LVKCTECEADIDLDEEEVEEGEVVVCPECSSELEVAQIHPVQLKAILDDDDDDDLDVDDDDDDDEDDKDDDKEDDQDDEEVGIGEPEEDIDE
jgi:alpha-aminoadipate/glutamate carrier protein LysW